MRRFSRILLAVAATFFAAAVVVHAAPAALAQTAPDLGLEYTTAIGLATGDVRSTAANIINAFLGLLGVVAVGIIMYAGYRWMTAQGEPEKVKEAQKMLIGAVVGLVIIFSAYAIARFVFSSLGVGEGTPDGQGGVCPPGQTCGVPLPGGTETGFRIDAITPAGPGIAGRGWPKNSALVVSFSANVAASTINEASMVVRRCNARDEAFDQSACDSPVAGTRSVDGRKVTFRPSATAGDNPTDFEGDFWYDVRMLGASIKDDRGRILLCPFRPSGAAGDISSPLAKRDLCDRAVAFADIRDVAPPSVTISVPHSPPGFCAVRIPVQAVASDDFAVGSVSFRVDGRADALVDAAGNPLADIANGDLANPFNADGLYIDVSKLSGPGSHVLTAVATDTVLLTSPSVQATFTSSPPQCCNGVQDADRRETGIDCGRDSGCGLCAADSCTTDAQCQSGFCNPATQKCEEQPIIDEVSPSTSAPGTLITLRGRSFGSGEGRVIFLGADTDGDGDAKGDSDDTESAACSPLAWSPSQVTVSVPQNAVSGPIELRTAAGKSDRTDAAPGWSGSFTVAGQPRPGICYLEPVSGTAGAILSIHGNGFGQEKGDSAAIFGGQGLAINQGGWRPEVVSAIVPNLREGTYPVKIRVGSLTAGIETNAVNFSLRAPSASERPRITGISPASGPVGSTVTVSGTGFGSATGRVRLFFGTGAGAEIIDAVPPICSDYWHDSYVVVKIPDRYRSGSTVNATVDGSLHKVEVETAAGNRTAQADFRVTLGTPAPSICAVRPDNGPPGRVVEIVGEGFGAGPGSAAASPSFMAQFFKSPSGSIAATQYGAWTPSQIVAAVPGTLSNKATWPSSGPLRVVAGNVASANSVPFVVQNCNDAGAACAVGTQCCANGSCAVSCSAAPREGAYGWQLSTDVLPSLPRVVERAVCDASASTVQSPSPFIGTTDACKNATIVAEFTKIMQRGTFSSQTVRVAECGTGAEPACGQTPAAVPLDSNFGFVDGAGTVLRVSPAGSYNDSLLKPGMWYRVTLVSDAAAKVGLQDAAGRYLDGDRNGIEGGSYVWTFRAQEGDSACALSHVTVSPGEATIREQSSGASSAHRFASMLIASNCNALRCTEDENYRIDWSRDEAGEESLELLAPETVMCDGDVQPASGLQETAPGVPAILTATATPVGETNSTSGDAEVTVKFADPAVIAYGPKCELACVNAAVYAYFNVPMDPGTLSAGTQNVELLKCRNSACNAPFDAASQRAISVIPITERRENGDLVTKGLEIQLIPQAGRPDELDPSTYYTVRLRGGEQGIRSASGVPLKNLNSGEFFSWIFKTKDSATPCAVARAELFPLSTALYYVSQRADFRVTPFGSPDQCDARGQALRSTSYDWDWRNVGGFVSGFIDPNIYPIFGATRLDTASVPTSGCDGRCLATGSQTRLPQCGNGKVEKGEFCDDGNGVSGDGCSSACLAEGTGAPACGDGVVSSENGESCDKIGGIFPPGCKDPSVNEPGRSDLDGIGCVHLGASTATGGKCGNAEVGDGEDCDDGNRQNGDGCSAECLFEGTLRSCLDTPSGAACVNFCGNGRVEPGEEAACEAAGGPVANGCNPVSCLRAGTSACANASGAGCCGNGTIDAGEEPSCEGAGGVSEFCTNRCLLKGSSYAYQEPSFCRDGILGLGEAASCDGSFVEPDNRRDPFQAIEAGPVRDNQTTTTIVATLPEITRESNRGTATVTMAAACGAQDDPQGFCSAIGASQSTPVVLGCDESGFCAVAPQVEDIQPRDGDESQCRNVAVAVTFDQPMNAQSLSAGGIVVGEAISGTSCPAGRQPLPLLAVSSQPSPSLLQRAWNAIAGFVRGLFGREALAEDPPNPASTVYCGVPGSVVLQEKTASFVPQQALSPNSWYRIFVDAEKAVGANTVPLADDFNSYFRTGTDICRIGFVTISPESHLFSIAEDLGSSLPGDAQDGDHPFVAAAHPEGRPEGEEIVSTPQYSFKWNWSSTVASSPVVVTPKLLPVSVNGHCEQGEAASSPDCSIVPAGSPVCGNAVCERPETADSCAADCKVAIAHDPSSMVSVRRGVQGFPKNGKEVLRVSADISEEGGLKKSKETAAADAVVMLCQQPWPARRTCTTDRRISPPLPWDPARTCNTPGQSVWYPFYDTATNIEFFYCRDVQQAGDTVAALPALREDAVKVQPGRDILFEYLFTFERGASGDSSRDAIGLRVSKNLAHQSIVDWYAAQGFRGSPQPTVIDGFEALQEGRTVYVNTVTRSDASLFTNVNVLSHSDGASPETVQIFQRILESADFSRNVKDFGFCIDPLGEQLLDSRGQAIACGADRDCSLNEKGEPDPALGQNSCLVLKSKLVRDARRFTDISSLRQTILARASQGLPSLEAGTYLRGQTTSRWPSWGETLSAEVGALLPTDPINQFSGCPAGFDPATCFNEQAKIFQCTTGSHIYQYQAAGGQDFRLSLDFEAACATITSAAACEAQQGFGDSGKAEPFCDWTGSSCQPRAAWAGSTCLEHRTDTSCAADAQCAWDGRQCNYAIGKVDAGGLNAPQVCADEQVGADGVCGDGIVQGREECEPGSGPSLVQCVDDKGRPGTQQLSCTSSCTFGSLGQCVTGSCGDGRVDFPEACDDGELNGRYGFCDSSCRGLGFHCGDGQRQPGEVCDCGDLNGAYTKNGILQPAGTQCKTTGTAAPSCSWDCSEPAPRCGDGIVNGSEECDGGIQESRGFCTLSLAACSSNADCGTGGGTCKLAPTPEQRYQRSCNAAVSSGEGASFACKYASWKLTAPGSCGNGVKETGEDCDDGNVSSTDACIIDASRGYLCKAARCGDGYVNSATELCDDGSRNGQACVPGYGRTCTYCSASCTPIAVSGGFCGNGTLEGASAVPPGPEQCEGSTGLLPNYICISGKTEDQSLGLQASSSCRPQDCRQGCPAGFSLCFNDPQSPDSEKNAQGQPAPDGIRDSCDPDKDNDGVPGLLDCNDLQSRVHGAYGNVPPVTEVCGDSLDNDCDGNTDNIARLSGRVKDMDNNAGIGGATVRVFCNGTEVGTATTAVGGTGVGTYTVNALVTGACTDFVVRAEKTTGTAFCSHQSMDVTVGPANSLKCTATPSPVPDIFLVRQPPVGGYAVVYNWTPVQFSYPPAGSGIPPQMSDPRPFTRGNEIDNATNPGTLSFTSPAANKRVTRFAPTAPATRMRFYLKEFDNKELRSSKPVATVWNNSCQMTQIASDPATGTAASEYWDGFIINITSGTLEPTNVFSDNRPPQP